MRARGGWGSNCMTLRHERARGGCDSNYRTVRHERARGGWGSDYWTLRQPKEGVVPTTEPPPISGNLFSC